MGGASFQCAVFFLLIAGVQPRLEHLKDSMPAYELDLSWKPLLCGTRFSGVDVGQDSLGNTVLFVIQRGDVKCDPVQLLDLQGRWLAGFGRGHISFDNNSQTWGCHGIAVETHTNGTTARIYINDIAQDTVMTFNMAGDFLFEIGTPYVSGNKTSPLQFGAVADSSIDVKAPGFAMVYVSDGDGGANNRIVKLAVNSSGPPIVQWVTPALFNNPHSLALHRASGVVVVADRDNASLQLLSADRGSLLGQLDCGLNLGVAGKPFGVRVWEARALLLVAIMDNPQDGRNQRLAIAQLEGQGEDVRCSMLQNIPLDPSVSSGPHLLGLDINTGDAYVALVNPTPLSTVLRFKCMIND